MLAGIAAAGWTDMDCRADGDKQGIGERMSSASVGKLCALKGLPESICPLLLWIAKGLGEACMEKKVLLSAPDAFQLQACTMQACTNPV